MRAVLAGIVTGAVGLALLLPSGCETREPTPTTYFDRTISPILTSSCVRANTGAGCHVEDAKGNALGNLDLTTYKGLARRRDLLVDYGPYGQPSFLVKNVDPFQVEVRSYDGSRAAISTDIKHAGGSVLDPTGSAYQTLRRWLANGATENNTGRVPESTDRLPCNGYVPARPDFDLGSDPPTPDFAVFRDRVNPVLTGAKGAGAPRSPSACAAGNCHGTVANALYFTCGDTPEQIRWNYRVAEEYLAQTAEESELLRRPLAPSQGGAYHEGGALFASTSDDGYVAIDAWARAHGPARYGAETPGFAFFARKVQPVLVKKGCTMLQCHSASMFHDYRLRGGSGGSFSLSATRRNYELSLAQMALESDDPNASRLVKKNLYRPEVCSGASCVAPVGIAHRGGPLFEDFGPEPASAKSCAAGNYDYDAGDLDKIPAYCVLAEWLKRERLAGKPAPLSAVVYVKRPLGSVRRAVDFDAYAPGSDLRRATVSVSPEGTLSVGEDVSLAAGCGLDPKTADVRRPQVSWDGASIVFAARVSTSSPLAVYQASSTGANCVRHPEIDATAESANGLLIHNFDPTFAPDGRIVFASTRGNLGGDASYDYAGPQRTPADPSKPNANLYVFEPDPDAPGKNRIRQLTYLLNMERQPAFMSDGRVVFTAQKRAPGFSQLALRRINLDGGDYHPLYAQRGSIGYPEASSVVELADKDFAAIFSVPTTPHGGGVLGVFNRSLGIDFTSKDPADYPVDPTVLDPGAPRSVDPSFFLRSLRLPDAAASARPGQPTTGVYATPAALPDGRLLVSFGAAVDAGTFGGDYDVWVMNPATGAKVKLLGAAGSAEVEAVGIYGRAPRRIFQSALDEPNGHTVVTRGTNVASVHVLDVPVLASLLFQNTPTGRVVDRDVKSLTVYEDMPPPVDVDSFEKGAANVANDAFGRVYVRRRLLGTVALESDGSAKFELPGGLPVVLELPQTPLSRERGLPRVQREQMVFAPGERTNQSFRAPFFDALCGHCHGSLSGKPVDVALTPDFVTQASSTVARGAASFPLAKPPAERGPVQGPP